MNICISPEIAQRGLGKKKSPIKAQKQKVQKKEYEKKRMAKILGKM